VRCPEENFIDVLKRSGCDLLCTLPCGKVRNLIALADRHFFRIPLTREEEGVGICAGAALAGLRPAMIIQSSGVGNLMNALLSLTGFYGLPLALFVSRRGVYKEGIDAQVPMGKALPSILSASGIGYTVIGGPEDLDQVDLELTAAYRENRIHAFLLSPATWEGSEVKVDSVVRRPRCGTIQVESGRRNPEPVLTRYEILEVLRPLLEGNIVVSNLGIPSKELHQILPQPSNFYMLGSMGMATPIGLGIALSTNRQVFVVDGDGSLLMNPGTLATVATVRPENLTILAVDNASYGSTGDQPTLTGTCVDLELVARGFGIRETVKVATPDELLQALRQPHKSPLFVHILALPGNADVPNIPIDSLEIKRKFQKFLQS